MFTKEKNGIFDVLRMTEQLYSLGGLRLFVLKVAVFQCFFVRLSGTSVQTPKGFFFGFTMNYKRLLFRVILEPDKVYVKMNVCCLAFTITIYVSMAVVVRTAEGFCPGTSRSLALYIFSFVLFYCLRDYFNLLRDCNDFCGVEGEVFARRREEFPLAISVVDVGQGVTFWLSWFVTVT